LDRLPRLADVVGLPALTAELWDRIQVADTDLSGIIYFDRYYRRAEAGFAELIRTSGASFRDMIAERFVTPAVSSRCDYFHPVTVDDRIRQVVFVSHLGRSSHTSDHHFLLEDGTQAATVRITRATIDAQTRTTVPIAAVFREAPNSHLARFLRAAGER
jgi:acyl-CoA thioesterase FadM